MSDTTETTDTPESPTTDTGNATGTNGGEKLLTQAQVDALIKERLDRAQAKWQKDAQAKADEKLPELDKLAKERDRLAADLDALTKRERERDAKESVRELARRAGASDPDLVFRALRADLEYGDDGHATNAAALVTDLKSLSPQLFRPATGKGDGGNGQSAKPAAGGMNAWIRHEAGHG